jgi:hypothetical protein
MQWRWLWLLLASCLAQSDDGTKKRFLIISSPSKQLIQYKELPSGIVQPLVDAKVSTPEGMVVQGNVLFIADPTQECITAFTLRVHDGHLIAQNMRKVVTGIRAHWVTYGGSSDGLLYSDQDASLIDQLPAGKKAPVNLYTGGSTKAVSGPSGVAGAAGSSIVYWTNTVSGTSKGSVVAGDITTGATTTLASNIDLAHGVCVSQNNVFFTADAKSMYAVKRSGGAVVEVASAFGKPRGCVYDGDGTVYVADKLHGKVYALPANMENLMAEDAEEAADAMDAYGVALYNYDADLEAAAKQTLWEKGTAEFSSFLRR